MKRVVYFILFMCLALSGNAQVQTLAWDSTYRPEIYPDKVEQFKSFQHRKSDIVFLGNSITAGTNWNELLQLPKARNRGISGDITFGVLGRLDEIIKGQPSKVFLLIGINDISRNIPDSVIIANYKKIIHRLRKESGRTEIYVQSILPVNNTFTKFPKHYNKDEHIHAVNQAIKQFCKEEKVAMFINLHTAFLDPAGRLDKQYTSDGLHLNSKGYALWSKILTEGKLNKRLRKYKE